MNSDMVKPEKFGHLHLVYHFAVPLRGWGIYLRPSESSEKEKFGTKIIFLIMLN